VGPAECGVGTEGKLVFRIRTVTNVRRREPTNMAASFDHVHFGQQLGFVAILDDSGGKRHGGNSGQCQNERDNARACASNPAINPRRHHSPNFPSSTVWYSKRPHARSTASQGIDIGMLVGRLALLGA
jgi:hypothetical protein